MNFAGDVHAGKKRANYGSFEINHAGDFNTNVALEWAFQNLPDPEVVFTSGCSAGRSQITQEI
jgi:hypothetical protein